MTLTCSLFSQSESQIVVSAYMALHELLLLQVPSDLTSQRCYLPSSLSTVVLLQAFALTAPSAYSSQTPLRLCSNVMFQMKLSLPI
jgi:hypothetical protein